MATTSDERRALIIREAKRMTELWQNRYLKYDESIFGSTDVQFDEPTRLVINGRELVTESAVLKAVTEPVLRLEIRIACEGEEALLTDVMYATDEITQDMKTALFDFGFGLLESQLDLEFKKAINAGPTNNELVNWFLRFM